MRICFHFEYKNSVGGVTSLLITLIRELSLRNVDVLLINFREGIIAKTLSLEGIEIEVVELEDFTQAFVNREIKATDVFVITSFKEIYKILFTVNPRLIYYNVNDRLTNVSEYKFGINPRFLAKKLILELIRKKSLVLMDDTDIRNAAERLDLKIAKPVFLPIPIALPEENLYLKKMERKSGSVKLSYIGRSVNWKLFPLKKILDDLLEIKSKLQKSLTFHIVVDSRSNLEKIVPLEKYRKAGLEIIVHENIRPSMINDFLLENSDLNFGMGTTALDSAKLGIPTVLVDYAHREFPANYKYDWLYNTVDFCLGKDISKKYQSLPGSFDMKTIIERFTSSPEFAALESTKTYSYVKQHSVSSVVDDLIAQTKVATFRFRDAKPYILYYNPVHNIVKGASRIGKRIFGR